MRLIDADNLIERIKSKCSNDYENECSECDECPLKWIGSTSTIDAEPVRHGRNITSENPVDEFVCSECKIHLKDYVRVEDYEDSGDTAHYEYKIKYCPECGAKMDLED